MIKYIIVALLAFTLAALAAIWVLSGGPRRVVEGANAAIDRSTPKEGEVVFKLPWQPAQLFPTIDISEALLLGEQSDDTSVARSLEELEAEYERLRSEVDTTRTFGNPSPFIGQVSIVESAGGLRSRDEYLQITAHYGNESAIDIAGWTLESALSGVRVAIPPSAAPFLANSANVLGPTALGPGAVALVMSAPSPVGVSFRENMCTGYLAQFQAFNPPLAEECPAPSQVLPLTESNLVQYGESCFDAAAYLPVCRFPQNLASVSYACKTYLAEKLSYNGCVSANAYRSGFHHDVWRVYLGTSGSLWRDTHDAIRLLDGQGRTVSVFVY